AIPPQWPCRLSCTIPRPRSMNPEPADRYPSASALAEAVQRWLAEEPVSAYRAVVVDLEARARSQPDNLGHRENLARGRVTLGLVLSGMARYADAEEAFRSAVAEFEAM